MTDNRNTILAVILSGLVLIAWQYFYNMPQMERQRAQTQTQAELNKPAPQAAPGSTTTPQPGATPSATTPAGQPGAARGEDLAAAGRREAGAEAVTALAHQFAGLISPLHGCSPLTGRFA